MIDLEGLEDVEESVIQAIIIGHEKRDDARIHPDLNTPSHPIARPEEEIRRRTGDPGWLENLRKKIEQIVKGEPNIYPLF